MLLVAEKGPRSRQLGFNIDTADAGNTRQNLFNSKQPGAPFGTHIYNAGINAAGQSVNLSKSLENHNNLNADRKYNEIIHTLKKREAKNSEVINSLSKKLK